MPWFMCLRARTNIQQRASRPRKFCSVRQFNKLDYEERQIVSGSPTIDIYIPLDSAAVALGSNDIALALEDYAVSLSLNIQIIRNGSRGMIWAEPLLEVQTLTGRIAFACVTPSIVNELIKLGIFEPGLDALDIKRDIHSSYLGLTEEIPWLKNQQRLTFARCGIIDPLSIDNYVKLGGLGALKRALKNTPINTVKAVVTSGLRGRGGAAFPAGIKWQTVHDCKADTKYIVCNADEGDSGTFADRLIMEGDPFLLIEGMLIAGYATGAQKGIIYLRSEYPIARAILARALDLAKQNNLLGKNILDSAFDFEIDLFIGAGAYICGEETSLLESLEGKRGEVRSKPPLPAIEGLFGKPTLIHNVISLCSVPAALEDEGNFYASKGMDRSLGTLPFQLAGNVRCGGLVELPFGITLRELLDAYGQGTLSGQPMRAIQIGGPLGAYLPENLWDTPLEYEAFAKLEAGIGHGGIVVFDDTVDLRDQVEYAFQFCVEESCGKCTPCRIGSQRGVDQMKHAKNLKLHDLEKVLQSVEDLCELMAEASLCAMGGMTPIPVRSAIKYFPEDFSEPTSIQGD